jgi:hypothetical protein
MAEQASPLPEPRRSPDRDWAQKIEIAKQARAAGQAMREPKSQPVVAAYSKSPPKK